nr:VOC family protein [Cellulomonas hominis]
MPTWRGRDRQWFELAVVDGDLDAEVARLGGLGARRLGGRADGVVELTDPDGGLFRLTAG